MKQCEIEKCTGCGACYNVCPQNAIVMKSTEPFGHIRASVIDSECVNCGACTAICPSYMCVQKSSIKTTYAACQKSAEKHKASSSGGIAMALYEYCISHGYWVVGVSVGAGWEPSFVITQDIDEARKFAKSKYIQAETHRIYAEIKEKLACGDKVLFIGLPCQCAAAKNYCRGFDDQLLVVDLICHGVPSVTSFRAYLEGLERTFHRIPQNVTFRNEHGECLKLSDYKSVYYDRRFNEDPFMLAFMNGDILGESCYQCLYATPDRIGDITLGDFWGVGELKIISPNRRPVSAFFVNSKKGKQVAEAILPNLYFEERTKKEAIDGNSQLRAPVDKGKNYMEMANANMNQCLFDTMTAVYGKYANKKYRRRIILNDMKKIGKALGLKKIRDSLR